MDQKSRISQLETAKGGTTQPPSLNGAKTKILEDQGKKYQLKIYMKRKVSQKDEVERRGIGDY